MIDQKNDNNCLLKGTIIYNVELSLIGKDASLLLYVMFNEEIACLSFRFLIAINKA